MASVPRLSDVRNKATIVIILDDPKFHCFKQFCSIKKKQNNILVTYKKLVKLNKNLEGLKKRLKKGGGENRKTEIEGMQQKN